MEIADVRKRLHETMARAKKAAADRRARADAAGREFDVFLTTIAVPLVRQIAGALRADGYSFTVSTPSGSVRLASEKNAEDFIELFLDSSGDTPRVIGHVSRSRGRRGIDAEHVVGPGDPAAIGEEALLDFLLRELEPFVER